MRPMMPSQVVQDLGLSGDALHQQLLDSEEERKKKLLMQAQAASGGVGGYGPTVQAIFPGLSGT